MSSTASLRSLSLPARFGLVAAMVGYVALALGSGADRLSAGQPDLASKIPILFADEAIRTSGAQALSAGQAGVVAEIGARALDSAPTNPQSAAMFGAGKLASGDRVTANRAFRIAGQLGWRVPITQSYWMGQALAAGNYDIAALRLDALLRQQPDLLSQRQLLDPMERNPAGQAALVRRMALKPPWLGDYARAVASTPRDVMMQRVEVLTEARKAGVVMGCDTIAPTVYRLYEQHLLSSAVDLWRAHCPAAGPGPVSDPDFTLLDLSRPLTMLSWQAVGNDALTVTLNPALADSGKHLTVEGNPPRSAQFLRQAIVLARGRYALTWQARNLDGSASDHVLGKLSCGDETQGWLSPKFDASTGVWRAELIWDGRCEMPELGFYAVTGPDNLWVAQIKMDRLP